jgi:hypothetical protein
MKLTAFLFSVLTLTGCANVSEYVNGAERTPLYVGMPKQDFLDTGYQEWSCLPNGKIKIKEGVREIYKCGVYYKYIYLMNDSVSSYTSQ